ncbi:uncharacterized protein LOC143293534 [Babylonia areolata]|uniref:uncharacterized protein LOC143293534 n=1 Tax=Babylonia areolata TaxID=304850 RepID=UPI003FD24674
MTGCLPHDSAHHSPQAFYTLATHPQGQGTTAPCHTRDSSDPGPVSAYPDPSQPDTDFLDQRRPYSADPTFQQPYVGPVSAEPSSGQCQCCPSQHQSDVKVLQPQESGHPASSETSPFFHPHLPGSGHVPQITHAAGSQFSETSEAQQHQYHFGRSTHIVHSQQQPAALAQEVAQGRLLGQSFGTVVSQIQAPAPHHPCHRPSEQQRYRVPTDTQPPLTRPVDCVAPWQHSAGPCSIQSPIARSSPPHTATSSFLAPTSASQYPSHSIVGSAVSTVQQKGGQPEYHHQQAVTPAVCQQPYHRPASPSIMLDRKPTLQVMTDRSPASPVGDAARSPHFMYPERHSSSPSVSVAPSSADSLYTSPGKHEANWDVVTAPKAAEMDSPMHQVQWEQCNVPAGGVEADSETCSSVLEDSSSSSREQSPFSTMAKSLSLHSPEHPPSPLTRKSPQPEMMASNREDLGEEVEGSGDAHTSSPSYESEFHPSKFKRRLHERYMLSLKDTSEAPQKIKEESIDNDEKCDSDNDSGSRQFVPKLERADSPAFSDSHMPKSARRSSLGGDTALAENTEVGATSADEGDVFMEPTMLERTKSKPSSLHQREPLDLSRAYPFSSFRSSSGSSPLLDPEHLSPASKISPVFRSPHRLPYSPHGLMSPQSQSPLCSVPEGGRIFNFNVPSPLEGVHSDSDLISPSPMSPRIFTFPPHSSLQNPMSEVNRLALSPRAPYTPPPFMRSKPYTSGLAHSARWGDEADFYSKRSLSESDMTYLCPMCGHVFASNDSLAKHIAKHLPSETVRSGDTKIHYCKVCNRSFSRSDMLTRHMRLHTGLKPYECYDCGQVFSRSDHLNTHRRTHTGEKPYRCPHCPYSACRRDMITRHMRTHTKQSSRRSRYLSVPDEGDNYKPSGSVSSTDRTDSQDFSVSGHCSVSSVDSVESESTHSPHPPPYQGTSADSALSPDQDRLPHGSQSSHFSHKMLDKAGEGQAGLEGGSSYNRFMQYRKGRNWSTTSVESVDSEEAVIREVLVDDAFLDTDPQPSRPGEKDRMEDEVENQADMVGLEAQNLQKCFISSQTPGKNGS